MITPDHKGGGGLFRGLKYDHEILEQTLIVFQIYIYCGSDLYILWFRFVFLVFQICISCVSDLYLLWLRFVSFEFILNQNNNWSIG